MNEQAKQNLESAIEKFKKMEMYKSVGDDLKAITILQSFTDDEIGIIDSVGKVYTEIAQTIRECINESLELGWSLDKDKSDWSFYKLRVYYYSNNNYFNCCYDYSFSPKKKINVRRIEHEFKCRPKL